MKKTITIAQKMNALADKVAALNIELNIDGEFFSAAEVSDFLRDRGVKSKKSASGTSKKALENRVLADLVYDKMVSLGKPIKASDVIGFGIDGVASTSKASSLLNSILVADGRVVKHTGVKASDSTTFTVA